MEVKRFGAVSLKRRADGGSDRSGETVGDNMLLARDVADLDAVFLNAKCPVRHTGAVGVLARHQPL